MIKNIKEFCRYFYAATFIPVAFYQHGKLAAAYPDALQSLYSGNYQGIYTPPFSENPQFYIMGSFAYLGCVQIAGSADYLLIGPVFSTPIDRETQHAFLQEFLVAPDKRTEISQFLSTLPLISHKHFLDALSYVHLCLNDEVVNLHDSFTTPQPHNSSELEQRRTESASKSKEEHFFHNTYLYEQELFSYIQRGDEVGLKTFTDQATTGLVEGVVAKNPLRQMKNIFITTITQATRAAVAGGLDSEQAYQLSDLYIQECETLQSSNAIAQLQHHMLFDFAARVAKSKIPQGMSPDIFQCVHFISCHTADAICIDDVVAHVGRSRSYLTKKFKRELGFDMGAFIMNCKLEEAKSLLTYSAKSLSEISNYLCFSSQSYFQTVFRKKFGVTPMQYRNESRK